MQTEMFIRANGKTTKHMEEESIPKATGQVIQASGFRTYNMDLVSKNGMMVRLLRENTGRE